MSHSQMPHGLNIRSDGAVVELLLKAQGRWDEILKHYEVSLQVENR
jgi:hypothetical protein